MIKSVSILTAGSRGDVQPYLALALGLKKAGFLVRIAAPHDFQNLFRDSELEFFPLRLDTEQALKSGKKSFSAVKRYIDQMEESWNDCLHCARNSDLILAHPKILTAFDIAEAFNIPLVFSHPVPMIVPIRDFPFLLFPNFRCGFLNKLSYSLLQLLGLPFLKKINSWRREKLSLPPRKKAFPLKLRNEDIPVLYGFSPLLFPNTSWPAHVRITGFWTLPSPTDYSLPRNVSDFLAAGSPPLCITFGSMPLANPKQFLKELDSVLLHMNLRAVFISGWSGLSVKDGNTRILITDDLPHQEIFPHVCAIVHHGGIGTTAAALMAGKPMIICPFMADQPFWGRHMKKLGVCSAVLPKLRAGNLRRALQKLLSDPSFSEQSQIIAEKLAKENGVKEAVSSLKNI